MRGIADIARRHPARLIRIGPASHAPRDPARLTARATALCHLRPGGGGYVCSEEIVLEHTEATAALVPSAVRAILIGDLPVVLLLLTSAKPDWLEALAAHADLQIADSCLESRASDFSTAWQRTGRRGTPMHDLAWARLEPWRAALADLFDLPEAAPALATLEEITIAHGGADPPSPAWLLAGWLASRLGWNLDGRDGTAFRFRTQEGRAPRIEFARAEGPARGEIVEVRAHASGTNPLEARLRHSGRGDTARLELRAPRLHGREIPFARRSLAEAIVGEIQRRGINPAFRDAARAARQMIES